jgi:hypothetical protein
LEGPEISVFYRGQDALSRGISIIHLPEYFNALTRRDSESVLLTCYEGYSPLFVDSKDFYNNAFTVATTPEGNPDQKFYWEVKAVRSDLPCLQVIQPKSKE